MKESLHQIYGLKKWRLAGIFALSVLGFLLHYLFSWTQETSVLGFFVPVNESIWEHLKLGFLSLVLFSVPEYFQIRKIVHNYFLSKWIGVLVLELNILLIFYALLKVFPSASKTNYDKSWKALFNKYHSLTTKEFALLSEIPGNESEKLLNKLTSEGHLTKTIYGKGALWKVTKPIHWPVY